MPLNSSPSAEQARTQIRPRECRIERADWTVFRSLNTIAQGAGVPLDQLAKVVGKELADNALDAAGGCEVGWLDWLDDDEHGFFVEDAGDGIPGDDDEVANLFSINRPMVSSKRLRRPSRGALGNGLRVVAGAVLASQGQFTVKTRGRSLELEIDEDSGRARSTRMEPWNGQGTRVEVVLGKAIPNRSEALDWAMDAIQMAGGTGSQYNGKSSPFWYDASAFYDLLKDSGDRKVVGLIGELDGCAHPRSGQICSDFKGREARSLTRDEAGRLLAIAREHAKPVRASRLGCVGPMEELGDGYARVDGVVEFVSTPGQVMAAELPVVVEAWATGLEDDDRPSFSLFVNRTRVVGSATAWMVKAPGKGMAIQIGRVMVPIVDAGRKAVGLHVNIETPYMPISSTGKEPDIWSFGELIQRAASKAIRIVKRKSTRESPTGSQRDVIFANIPAGAAQASGNNVYRFSQRQLFYAIRPAFMEVFGEEPKWDYFTQVLTDYENENGDIDGLYRDPRGVIYHPHQDETIPLGTMQVEKYERPAWMFNKLLYCEKEGFFEILRAVRWPEMNDCALMTSKGFSSRAAKDLIDLIAETDEACQVFCVHDADASGTMIYQTLQEATRSRPEARKVKIIDLGLNPAEARAMSLPVESFASKSRRLPVADGIPDDDKEWLQTNRIELNAMSSPDFLTWLDRKFAEHNACEKLIPPAPEREEYLEARVGDVLRQNITAEILRKADIDSLVGRAIDDRADLIGSAGSFLEDHIRQDFVAKPDQRWSEPVDRIAVKICSVGEAELGP